MKKTYQQPTMAEIFIQVRNTMLSGSWNDTTETGSDEFKNTGASNEAMGRSGFWGDDDE